jgi:hypothetical protein
MEIFELIDSIDNFYKSAAKLDITGPVFEPKKHPLLRHIVENKADIFTSTIDDITKQLLKSIEIAAKHINSFSVFKLFKNRALANAIPYIKQDINFARGIAVKLIFDPLAYKDISTKDFERLTNIAISSARYGTTYNIDGIEDFASNVARLCKVLYKVIQPIGEHY